MASELRVTTIANNAGSESVDTTYVVNGSAKAFLTYDQSSVAIDGSFNVSSVTDNSTGNWNVNYTNNMDNATYTWLTGGQDARFAGVNTGTVPTTSTVRLYTRVINTAALADVNLNTAGIHGDLA
jgi:hypothetical protein